jgi:tRNA pseudouridine55 synthase
MTEQSPGTNKAPPGPSAGAEGLLLLHKKPGLTSFEALAEVKRALGTSRVGHTGTLDKFAEGLLPVLVGRAVKLSPWFSHCPKEYRGRIRFGFETGTLDPEGQIVAEGPLPSREALEAVLPRFRGPILQAPPAYSAIHLGGRRASELARSGEAPEMRQRPVNIYRLELAAWDPPFAEITVSCSSGTYIRSLARDIALAAASRAHLAALTRTRFAGFDLSQAFSGGGDNGPAAFSEALLPINRTVLEALGLPRFDLPLECLQNIIHGKPLSQVLAGQEFRYPVSSRESCPVPGPANAAPEAYPAPEGAEKTAAAVFCGETFAGIIEQRPGGGNGEGWSYGYVYAAGRGEGRCG